MIGMSNKMTATTSSTWINPPIVYELTSPRAQRTRRMTVIVQSIGFLRQFLGCLSSSETEGECVHHGRRGAGPQGSARLPCLEVSAATQRQKQQPSRSGPRER